VAGTPEHQLGSEASGRRCISPKLPRSDTRLARRASCARRCQKSLSQAMPMKLANGPPMTRMRSLVRPIRASQLSHRSYAWRRLPRNRKPCNRLKVKDASGRWTMTRRAIAIAVTALTLLSSAALAQGGGGAGAAGGSAGSAGGMSGSAGTGNTSTGIGPSTGASSQNTVGQSNRNPISPANPSTARLGGTNSLPVPQGTVTSQDPQNYDPRLSPGYQK
jgi:hypothetical protein